MSFTIRTAETMDVLALLDALGPGGHYRYHAGDESRVLGGLSAAAERGEVAVAYADGELAGFLRAYIAPTADPVAVDSYGVVFEPYRRRGIGGALIDWLIALAARSGRAGMAEVIVDRLHEDEHLAPVLRARSFSEQVGSQLTRAVRDAAPALAPGVRRLLAADWPALEPVYVRSFAHEPRSGRGPASLDGIRNHPWLRADLSLVAVADGVVAGFLMAVVWEGDPDDVWIESVCVAPEALPWVGEDLVGSLLTVAKEAGFTTVSVGETSGGPVARLYEGVGFTRACGWSRHSLLVMA